MSHGPGDRGSAMALVQSQQFTGSGLGRVLGPLLFVPMEAFHSAPTGREGIFGAGFPRVSPGAIFFLPLRGAAGTCPCYKASG
jgi:hypothetical protein